MDGLPAVSCTFFNFVCVSLSPAENLTVHTEHNSSTSSCHRRCKLIFMQCSYLGQLSVTPLFIQIGLRFYHLWFLNTIEAHWEKPAWRIVGAPSAQVKYIWSSSYRVITVSNYFLAPRFDFIAKNCCTTPYFSRWCLDSTLDFMGAFVINSAELRLIWSASIILQCTNYPFNFRSHSELG